jgi:hypothetical protein
MGSNLISFKNINKTKILAPILLLFLTASWANGDKTGDEWLKWSKRQCNLRMGDSTGATMPGAGILLGGKQTDVLVTWMTDQAWKVMARRRQIDERLTNEETIAYAKSNRDKYKDYYVMLVEAENWWYTGSNTRKTEGLVVDTKNEKTIFLQSRKDKNLFIRPVKVEMQEAEERTIRSSHDVPSVSQNAFILFPRDEEFLKKADYEIELQMTQQKRVVRVKMPDPRKMEEDFSQL